MTMASEPAAHDPDAAADAIRDALALVRAALADDPEAGSTVAEYTQSPVTVTLLLAGMAAQLMRDAGLDAGYLAAWQANAGL